MSKVKEKAWEWRLGLDGSADLVIWHKRALGIIQHGTLIRAGGCWPCLLHQQEQEAVHI
jgi:hypothetical protein